MDEGSREGARYGARDAFAVRPSAEVAGEDAFARTALDPPRFTEAMLLEAAAVARRATEAQGDSTAFLASERAPSHGERAPLGERSAWWPWALALAVAVLGGAAGAAVGIWLATQAV